MMGQYKDIKEKFLDTSQSQIFSNNPGNLNINNN